MKTPRLETKRLSLREIRETDTRPIFDCWMQDDAVARYMLWEASSESSAAAEFVEFELGQIENPQWFRWLIFLRETRQLIGTCLVYFNTEDNPAHWDISYNLGRQYWGQGFAFEAMEAAMGFAVEQLDMTVCITTFAKENRASANILHKLGFRDEAGTPYVCGGGMATQCIRCRFTAQQQL